MKSRRYYASQYKIVPKMNDRGKLRDEYIYIGKYYRVSIDDAGFKRLKWSYAITFLICAALFVGALFVDNLGMRQMFVAIPAVVILMPLCIAIGDVYKIATNKRDMTEREKDGSTEQLKGATVAMLISSGAAFLGELVYLIFLAQDPNLLKELLFAGCMLIIALVCVVSVRIQNTYPAVETQKDAPDMPAPSASEFD